MQPAVALPLIIRGEVFETAEAEFRGRHGSVSFTGPDVGRYLDRLTLPAPSRMADLYEISFGDILDYLEELGERLTFAKNARLQDAFRLACEASGVPASVRRTQYERLPSYLRPDVVRNVAERSVGIAYLEGWVDQLPGMYADTTARVRAFGARCVHVIAGNAPQVSVITILRNAITRSDAIIKAPSNDPLTALAVVGTMVEMAPDHPLTKHVSAAYWKGGDQKIESALYDPRRIEKIVAWGGFASIQHMTQYLQPGLDLITLDPKLSGTIIGAEAFADEATLATVAQRLALDIGAGNQEGCVAARVVYAVCGTDDAGLVRANRLGELTFAAVQALPPDVSTPHNAFDPELKAEIDGIRHMDEDYRVFGGTSNEGAIIVSQMDSPVDFSRLLACRVANIVPIDDVATAVRSVNAYTQTVGIYPEALKDRLRDQLAYQGAQRLVPLGGASAGGQNLDRQDAIEPIRRMCKWIVEERRADGVPALSGLSAE
jgi:hypothetical protein